MTDRKRTFRGDRLRDIRMRRGLTQAQLGERTLSSTNQIGRYEAGEADPSIDLLVRLVNELVVSADWLIGVSEVENQVQDGFTMQEVQFVDALRTQDAIAIIRIAAQTFDVK